MSQGYRAKPDEYNVLAKDYTTGFLHTATDGSSTALLRQLDAVTDLSKASHILDLGCGPGQITAHLIQDYGSKLPKSVKILAADVSPDMIKQVQLRRDEAVKQNPQSLWRNVNDLVCDAQNLSRISKDSISHITAGLVLFLLPKPQDALKECYRVLRSSRKGGGVLTASCWPKSDWQELMKLLVQVDPTIPEYEVPEEWQTGTSVRRALEKAGFKDVVVSESEVYVEYGDPSDVYRGLITTIPYLIRHTANLRPKQLEILEHLMVKYLKRQYGAGGGRMVGTTIVVSGKK